MTDIVNICVSPFKLEKMSSFQQTSVREKKVGNYLHLNLEAPQKETSEVQTNTRNLTVGNQL